MNVSYGLPAADMAAAYSRPALLPDRLIASRFCDGIEEIARSRI
jgi:hypothetical protein